MVCIKGRTCAASLCAAVAYASLSFAAEVSPGVHKSISCDGKPEWTYSLYVPRAYAQDAEHRLPVLFISSPVGNPTFMGHEQWAERNGVILVLINDSKNGQGKELCTSIQAAVVSSVEAKLKLHGCLRFSMGISGAAMVSMWLAQSYSAKHAGVLMLSHSGNGTDRGLARHIAVAFVHGEKDTVHGVEHSRRVCADLASRGNPTRIVTGPWGHGRSTKVQREEMLDWMLPLMRLTHPNLPPGDVAAAKKNLAERMDALPGIEDQQKRLEEAQWLQSLPDRFWKARARDIYVSWFEATMAIALAKESRIEAHEMLTEMSEDVRLRACSSKQRNRLGNELRRLRREPDVRKEYAARKAYLQVKVFEDRLPNRPPRSRLMQVVNSYTAIARKYPDTKYGSKAAEAASRLNAQ